MIDEMKFSQEKIDLIKASMTEEENILSYFIPILRYHSRFSSLTKEDFIYLFKDKQITHNGFLINQNIKPVDSLPTKKPLPTYEFADIDYEYLDKIYELCQENNIKLVLMKAPSVYPYWYQEYEDQIIDYIKDKDIDYYKSLRAKYNIILRQAIDAGADSDSVYIIKKYKEKILESLRAYYNADLSKSCTIVRHLISDVAKDPFAVNTLLNSDAFGDAKMRNCSFSGAD